MVKAETNISYTVGAESISLFSENCKFLKIVLKKVKYLGKKRFVSGYGGT